MAKGKPIKKVKLSKKTTKTNSKPSTKKNLNPTGEDKPKRKRRISDYLVLQSAISKYCLDRYDKLMADPSLSAEEKKKIRKKCTKKEVSEIYQGLKSRFLTSKTKGLQINAGDLSNEIESKLSYKNRATIPFTCREFEWYMTIDMLYGSDGFYFKPSDTLNFNCNMGVPFDMGVFSTEYNQLEDYYKDEMYAPLREYMEHLQEESDSSIKPIFVFNEQLSDIENRIFWWDLDDGGMGEFEPKPKKEKSDDLSDDFELSEEDIAEEVEKGKSKGEDKPKGGKEPKAKKEISNDVLLAREKTKQEQEKSKQMAMELLKDGLISKSEFKKLIGL